MFNINSFNNNEQEELTSFFSKLNNKIKLSKRDKKLFIDDYEKLIDYYVNRGYSIKKIIKLINIDVLRDNYIKKDEWYPLDNSAKIYPFSMKENWMSMYRISYYLKEDINPVILQVALDNTMARFPLFNVSLRKGFFWNYFDSINRRYDLSLESEIPFSQMNVSKVGKKLLRVFYYKNRISIEVFHILADAHGGLVFISTLLGEYFRLLDNKVSYNDIVLNLNSGNFSLESKDEFLDKKLPKEKTSLVGGKAVSIDGNLSHIRPCQVIHFDLDYCKFHDLAKSKNVTINQLMLGFIFMVLSYSTSRDGKIKIQVPVDMRKFYKSSTLRNFSMFNSIDLDRNSIHSLDEILEEIKMQSLDKLSKETLDGQMREAYNLVKSIRLIPLIIKKPIASFIFKNISDKSSTTVLSNLGKINLPENLRDKVLKMDFSIGTSISNKVLFGLITSSDTLTLSITKFTSNTSIENNLYNVFKEYDLIKLVHGSDKYEIRK